MEQGAPDPSGGGHQASAGPPSAGGPPAGAPGSAPAPTAAPGKRSWKARPPKGGLNPAAAGTAPAAALGVPPAVPAAAGHVLMPTKSQDSHTGSKGTAGPTDVNQATSGTGMQQRMPTPTPAQASAGAVPGQYYQQLPYTGAAWQAHPNYAQAYQPGAMPYPSAPGVPQQAAGLPPSAGLGAAQPIYAGNAVPPGYSAGFYTQQQLHRPQLDPKIMSIVQLHNNAGQALPELLLPIIAAALGLSHQEVQRRALEKRLLEGFNIDQPVPGAPVASGIQQQFPPGMPTGSAAQAVPGGSMGAVSFGPGAASVSADEKPPSLGSAGGSGGVPATGSHGLPSAGGIYSGMVPGVPPVYPGQHMMHPGYAQQYAVHPQTGVPMMPPGLQAAWQQQQQAGVMGQAPYGTHAPGAMPGQAHMHPGFMHPQQPLSAQGSMQQAGGASTPSVKHPLQRTAADMATEQRELPARSVTSLQFMPGQLCPLQQDELRVCSMTVHPCLKDWAEACQTKWKQRIQAQPAEEREETFEEFEKQVNMNKLYETRATELYGRLRAVRKSVAQRLDVKGMADLPATWELQGVRAVQDDNKLGRGLVAAQDLAKGYVLGPLGGYVLPGGLPAQQISQQTTSLAAHQWSAAGKAGRTFPPLQAGDEAPQDVDWSLDATRYTFHIDLIAEEGGVEQKVTMDVWGLGYGNLGMLINDAISSPHQWARSTSKLAADQAAAAAEYTGKGNNVEVLVVEVRGLPIPLLVTSQPVAAGEPLRLGYGTAYWRAHCDALTEQRDWYIEAKGTVPPAREKIDSLLLLVADVAGGGAVPGVPPAAVQPAAAGEQTPGLSTSQPAVPTSVKQELQPPVQPTLPSAVQAAVPAPQAVQAVQSDVPEIESVQEALARRRARYSEIRQRGLQQQESGQQPGLGSPSGGGTSVPQPLIPEPAAAGLVPAVVAGLPNGGPGGLQAQGLYTTSMNQASMQSGQPQTTQAVSSPQIKADAGLAARRKAILESSAALIDSIATDVLSPTRSTASVPGQVQGSPTEPDVAAQRRAKFQSIRMAQMQAGVVGSAGIPPRAAPAGEGIAGVAGAAGAGAALGVGVGEGGLGVGAGVSTVPGTSVADGKAAQVASAAAPTASVPQPPSSTVHVVVAAQPDATSGAAQKRGREEVTAQPAGDGIANTKRTKESTAVPAAGHTMQPPPGVTPHMGSVMGSIQPPGDLAAQAVAAYDARMQGMGGDSTKQFLFESLNDGSWQEKMRQPPWYAPHLKKIEELNQAVTWRTQ